MTRGKSLILALAALVATACASGGGAGTTDDPGAGGNRPQDNSFTTSAGVHLMQAGLAEGQEADSHFQAALEDAMNAIQEQPSNPKGYLLAGQASVGLNQWVQADTMFDRAESLYPTYGEQIASEREQGWVQAYNLGAEAMGAGETERALELFGGADVLYQERPEARMALGSLYLRTGDTEGAIDAYRGALDILNGPPPEGMAEEQMAQWAESRQVAAFNAAQLLAESGDYDEAATVLQGFLADNQGDLDPSTVLRANTALAGFLAQSGQAEEAEAMYEEILSQPNLTSNDYFQVGIGFFNTGDYVRAGEAFTRAAELNPYSRDALLNRVQSLYSEAQDLEQQEESPERNERLSEIYSAVLETSDRVLEFDPLNRNVLTFQLRALRGQADLDPSQSQALEQRTQELYRVYQNQPYEVSNVTMALQGDDAARLTGTLTNRTADAGTPVQLRFEAVNAQGQAIDTQMVTVSAPAQQSAAQFEASLDLSMGEFAGWRYEVVE
ncbi:MAG: tetratricopeptide repeat protein [Gemmatimonadota bacterium]